MLSSHNARVWAAIMVVAILIVLAVVLFGNHTNVPPADCTTQPELAACQ